MQPGIAEPAPSSLLSPAPHHEVPTSAVELSLYPALEAMLIPWLLCTFPASLDTQPYRNLLHSWQAGGLYSLTALHYLQEAQWQVLVLLLLKGLSLEKLPALQPAFESRDGVAAVQGTLEQLGTHLEELHALMDILLIAD